MSIKTIQSSYSSICLPSNQTFFPPGPAKGQIYNTLNCLVFFPLLSSGPSGSYPLTNAYKGQVHPPGAELGLSSSLHGFHEPTVLTAWQWVVQGADWAVLPSLLLLAAVGAGVRALVEHPRAKEGSTEALPLPPDLPKREKEGQCLCMKPFEHLARWRLFLWVY